MIIWVKKIKSCPEKSSWAHECSLKIAKWPTKMGTPSLRYNMSLTICKDDMRFFRSLWRHSNQNQIIEIDILIFFEGVPLLLSLLLYQLVNVLYFRSFSKPFLICLPICCFYAFKKKIVNDRETDYYPFWWEVPTKPLIRLFQKAKLRTHNLTCPKYSKLIIRLIIYNIKFEASIKVKLLL